MSIVDFVLPSLGTGIDGGSVVEWLIAPGDSVERGSVVAVVETEKADIDVEIWHHGVVTEILVPPGLSVEVGTPLARINVGGGDDSESAAPEVSLTTALQLEAARQSSKPAGRSVPSIGETVVHEENYHGALRRGPDRNASAASGSSSTDQPMQGSKDRKRSDAARIMARSNREIPHYYLATDIDLEPAMRWLDSVNVERSTRNRVLPSAALIKATALALAGHPELNGFWIDDRFDAGRGVHLGVAISMGGDGLVVPTIHDADQLTVLETMAALRDLAERARNGRLRDSELVDTTVTVTDLGDSGVDVVHGALYPPQVALIGYGRIANRPTVYNHAVVARRQVTATLAADHRASNGQRGARLLNAIDQLLQEPEQL